MTTRPTNFWFSAAALGAWIALAGGGLVAQEPAAKPKPSKAADAAASKTKDKDAWGSVKGRFVFDGPIPAPVKINVGGLQFCGQFPLVREDLVVGPKGGIANVVVWLRDKKVKVKPSLAKPAVDKVFLDTLRCRFVPHVVGVRVGQTLVIKNFDPVAHNAKIDGATLNINWLLPQGGSVEEPIKGPENLPAPISDSINAFMHAWMVARPNPYFAISEASGDFQIKDIPAGEWEFQIWQEKADYVTAASVGGEPVKWTKGRVKWTVVAGKTTDVGEIKIAPAQFNK